MNAALSRYFCRWRSTQLYDALRRPPTNHFQNGGLLVSRVVSQYLSQVSRSAYSLKHSGYLSSVNRSRMAGSVTFACSMNFAGGRKYSSSRQWTAISDSETCTSTSCSVAIGLASIPAGLRRDGRWVGRAGPPPETFLDYDHIGFPTGSTARGAAIELTTPAADAYQATSAVTRPTQPPRATRPVPSAWPANLPRKRRISVISSVRNTRKTATLTRLLQKSMYVLKMANARRIQARVTFTSASASLPVRTRKTVAATPSQKAP